MKILIHAINFSPDLTGIGKYTGELAQWLAAQGHEIRVVTAPPYYPQWKVAEGFVNRWSKEEVNPPQFFFDKGEIPSSQSTPEDKDSRNLVVYRCPLWIPAKPSGLKRVLHLASFAISSFPIMTMQIFWRPDIVLAVEPPLFCAPQALLMARLSGGKAWLHIQDYEVDAAFDLGLLKGVALRRVVAICERWLMRNFDLVSTISQRMLNRALAKGAIQERLVLFPNWVDLLRIRTQYPGLNKYRAVLGVSTDVVVALYSGNMGEKQGLEILAQAADLLQDVPKIVFVFCGNGSGRASLEMLCEGMSNARFMDLQPPACLGELLAMADIHLLPQRAGAADLVMPSKLTGMLASGRPVVATAYADTELATVVSICGLVVEPSQPQAFADAIYLLSNDAAMRANFGRKGRAHAVAHFGRDMVFERIEREIKAIARRR